MEPRTAFVTGATGLLGLNLVEALCADGWEVTALHRGGAGLSILQRFPVRLAEGDITDPESLMCAMPEGAGCVFHLAASLRLWRLARREQERINVGGTRNVVDVALRRDVHRFVFASSTAAYGLDAGRLREDLPLRGAESWIGYVRTKSIAERVVRTGIARGLDAVILNPPNLVGRYDRGNWSRMIRMVHERTLPGVPPGIATFAHAAEVARMHVVAAERGRPGESYLLGGVEVTWLDFVRAIAELIGRPLPRWVAPALPLRALARLLEAWSLVTRKEPDITPEGIAMVCSDQLVDSTKAERELGYRAVPLKVMIEDCYRWMLDAGLLSPD
jgi:dihydroflavonol-4-reductase